MRLAAALAALLLVTATAAAQPSRTRPSVPQRERLAATGVERVGYRWGDGTGPDASLRRASTLTTRGGVAVTRTVAYPDDDTTGEAPVLRTFRVATAGGTLATWTDEVTGVWTDGYDALSGDLDGDGSPELVVVEHVGTGNGLGVATWEVFVLPLGQAIDGALAPMRFLTVDYGPTGLVQRVAPGARGLRIVAASWEDGTEAGRGAGLYYTARFYRYADGRLAADGPVVQRRLLFSFQRLRGREYAVGRYAPDRWLARGTRRLRSDPGIPAVAGPQTRVAAGAFEPFGGYRVAGRDAVAGAIGDLDSRRLFPIGYTPLGLSRTWPEGQAARLESIPSAFPDGEPQWVLWLER